MTRLGFLAPCLHCRRADSDERVGPLIGPLVSCQPCRRADSDERVGPLNGPLVPCQPCWRADSDERVGPLNGPPRVGFRPHGSKSGNRVSAPCSRLAGPSPATACQLPAPTSWVRVQQPGAVRLSTLWYLIRPSSETLSAPCSRLAGPSLATACRLPASRVRVWQPRVGSLLPPRGFESGNRVSAPRSHLPGPSPATRSC